MSSIFETSNIARDIFLCTQIKIIENIIMPALICIDCLNDLKVAIRFRSNVIKAQKFFEENICNPTVKNEDSSEERIETNIKTEPLDDYDIMHNILDVSNDGFENVNVEPFQEIEIVKRQDKSSKERKESSVEKCVYCNKSFKKSYIKRHHSRAHPQKSQNHHQIVNEEDNSSLFCKICKYQYTSQNSLRKHMKVKHEFVDIRNRFQCDYCGRLFIVKDYILRHMKVRHMKSYQEKRLNEENNSAIPCDQCGKILKNRGLLKSHMRSHQIMTADDYWYCDLCPRKFKTRGGCSWHIKQRHVLKATYKCPYTDCTMLYKGKWELKMHIKSKHTDIRDYRCELCGKGFCDKQKLQIHTRIHTNERPHACNICTATFIHQTDLRRHIWNHTGWRPYKCEVINCGRGFMKKSELRNHTNRCHSNLSTSFNYNV
ncbi:hypothetical protein PVAND_010322 [Polypedilum vanderplanki]|uniref:Zinc finger protein n=1 Tax=Polypedilum vanderplanki TaxID=319348 RepID=A0A9J6CF78_POLVA|nr:hypothetical protein PVAND_010322 [Polypedilum vanderplanki]